MADHKALELTVVIPREPKNNSISPGSGIVSVMIEDFYRIYFEGNLYGASNLETIEERLHTAADRLISRYPTVARRTMEPGLYHKVFKMVGKFTYETRTLEIDPKEREAWKDWVSSYASKSKR